MHFESTPIEGLVIIHPRVYSDNRGHFFENFNQAVFNEKVGEQIDLVQDNESLSAKNVLRGLHFQSPPTTQGKLVRVIRGAVLDVAVDLRKKSSTYGQHYKLILSGENKIQLWIPRGFAHGFLSLEDDTIFTYKCSAYYSPAHETTLQWNDPSLAIDWGISEPLISEKDKHALAFDRFITPF